jgi:hypothetical protein
MHHPHLRGNRGHRVAGGVDPAAAFACVSRQIWSAPRILMWARPTAPLRLASSSTVFREGRDLFARRRPCSPHRCLHHAVRVAGATSEHSPTRRLGTARMGPPRSRRFPPTPASGTRARPEPPGPDADGGPRSGTSNMLLRGLACLADRVGHCPPCRARLRPSFAVPTATMALKEPASALHDLGDSIHVDDA